MGGKILWNKQKGKENKESYEPCQCSIDCINGIRRRRRFLAFTQTVRPLNSTATNLFGSHFIHSTEVTKTYVHNWTSAQRCRHHLALSIKSFASLILLARYGDPPRSGWFSSMTFLCASLICNNRTCVIPPTAQRAQFLASWKTNYFILWCCRTDTQYQCGFAFVYLLVESALVVFRCGHRFGIEFRKVFHCFGYFLRHLRHCPYDVPPGETNGCQTEPSNNHRTLFRSESSSHKRRSWIMSDERLTILYNLLAKKSRMMKSESRKCEIRNVIIVWRSDNYLFEELYEGEMITNFK